MDHRILEPVRTARIHEQPPAGPLLVLQTIHWMLQMIHSQLERFAQNDKRQTLLTEIHAEHEEPMLILEQTLRKLCEILKGNSDESALALYQLAMTLSYVPESHSREKPIDDPRTYYYQILHSHPALENMRTCAIDESLGSSAS